MSRSKITILCIAAALSGLVVNSTAAYAAGLEPAIFAGPVFYGLLAAWSVCWIAYALAGPTEHRDRCERARNFSTSIHYCDGDRSTDSGSWRRPNRD